jgi:hypothetical protein
MIDWLKGWFKTTRRDPHSIIDDWLVENFGKRQSWARYVEREWLRLQSVDNTGKGYWVTIKPAYVKPHVMFFQKLWWTPVRKSDDGFYKLDISRDAYRNGMKPKGKFNIDKNKIPAWKMTAGDGTLPSLDSEVIHMTRFHKIRRVDDPQEGYARTNEDIKMWLSMTPLIRVEECTCAYYGWLDNADEEPPGRRLEDFKRRTRVLYDCPDLSLCDAGRVLKMQLLNKHVHERLKRTRQTMMRGQVLPEMMATLYRPPDGDRRRPRENDGDASRGSKRPRIEGHAYRFYIRNEAAGNWAKQKGV